MLTFFYFVDRLGRLAPPRRMFDRLLTFPPSLADLPKIGAVYARLAPRRPPSPLFTTLI